MTPARLRWSLLVAAIGASTVIVAHAFAPIPHSGGDNSGYVSLADGLLTTGSYSDVFDPQHLPHTKYPPAFPLLLAFLISLGARTWVALKMSAAVPTVVAVGAAYLWAERRLGAVAGFAVALLLAVSAGVVYYSHWILSDPLFLVFTLLGLLGLSRADEAWSAAGASDGSTESGRDANGEPDAGAGAGSASDAGAEGDQSAKPGAWLALGVVGTGLAYFTRSAGLPLVVALLAWLALRRRWRALGVSAAVLGVPMLAWWLRGRGDGVAQYGAEFWLVDPYDPSRGRVGLFGLLPRVIQNLSAYTLSHIPGGVVGSNGRALALIGIALSVMALAGWALSVRRRIGPAELFLPLYSGLILLWPVVWGGDRFALPLFPLFFYYGAVALRAGAHKLPAVAGSVLMAVALLVLLLPASAHWLEASRQNAACAGVARERGPWACYGPRIESYVEAATWAGRGLPPGSAVLTRKPRHFYVLSGLPSRTFPFSDDAAAQLALADSLGARYVLLDQWDGLAMRYVGAAIRSMPGAFCFVRGFGEPAQGGAQLLGILAPDERGPGPGSGGIVRCPTRYFGADDAPDSYSSSGRIPLLDGLDS